MDKATRGSAASRTAGRRVATTTPKTGRTTTPRTRRPVENKQVASTRATGAWRQARSDSR